ncbi:hypothetical protein MY11210_005748 [Beauveria gryllotalpidicola]
MPLRKALKFPRPSLEAQCTHTTMTRVYGVTNLCCACHRPGPFGWVYQCTQDQEGIIDDALAQGDLASSLAIRVLSLMLIQLRSRAAAIKSALAWLTSATSRWPATDPINSPHCCGKKKRHCPPLKPRNIISANTRFQGSTARKECLYRICARCRPTCVDRAYISIDAVADGQIPPTAATGFGFHSIAGRPVTDARLVKTIGQRPVPPDTPDSSPRLSWLKSSLCLMDLLERQIVCGGHLSAARDSLSDDTPCSVSEPPPCLGTLTRSPPCNNLESISQLLPEDPPVSPILGVHTRGDTESSYTNLRLGAGNGFERGISDMITAA